MTDLLTKLFIKEHDKVEKPSVRSAYGTLSSVVGIICNILLSTLKLIAGALSGSLSVTADALNNLSDAASSVVLLFGFRLASKKADSGHPFGHGRIEYLSGLIVSFLIMLMGFELLKTSFSGIFSGEVPNFSVIAILILCFSLLTKLWLWRFNNKLGKRINSQAMLAGAADSLGDCISTVAVLLGALITHLTSLNFDGYIGCGVALLIMYAGFKSAKETISPLLGKAPEREFVEKLEKLLCENELVIDIHDLIVHDYGPGKIIVSVHTEVPANKNLLEIHDFIDNLERKVHHELGCEITIHMDPVDVNDPQLPMISAQVYRIVKGIDKRYMFHDLRIVSGPTHTNILFDVAVPAEDLKLADNIEKQIKEKLHEADSTYFAVVRVEQRY